MPIVRLDLGYDGSGFRGYAKQEGQRTVQGELESALAVLLGETPDTSVAGRTDAGVHARGQVVSFPWDGELDFESLRRSLNGIVGPEVAVMEVTPEADGFSARFSALSRLYRYTIDMGAAPDPLARNTSWHVARSLDIEAMRSVADALMGEHDFGSFCRSVEGRSNVRRVNLAEWVEEGDRLRFWIGANAFCHQMVRSIVGYSYDVGRGFSDPNEVRSVISARDRSAVATVAPPHGLVLWEVGY